MKKCLLFFLLVPFCAHAQMQLKSYNTGTLFSCITVDSNYNIWAGTNKNGLYLLNKKNNSNASQFTVASTGSLSTYNIQALAADQYSNVWVGHNGSGGSFAGGGGIEQINMDNPSVVKHYLPDRNAECFTFIARDGIATLNSASLSVDRNGTVWSAHKYHDLFLPGTDPQIINGVFVPGQPAHYIITPGSLSYKFSTGGSFFSKGTWEDYRSGAGTSELPYPEYTCDAPVTATPQTRNCYAVACGKNEVWVSVAAYIAKGMQSIPARIIKYNLDGTYSGISYDFAAMGIPPGGIVNGLYVAPNGDLWVTLSAAKGFAVKHAGTWSYMTTDSACIFAAQGTATNVNAIWGNKLGQVFIGTNKGLIVYRGTGSIDSKTSYTLYTAATHGLISDQILGGASEKDSIQWIATDNGIMRSTLGKNYPLSADDVDYRMCSNLVINETEGKLLIPGATAQRDYHSYRVETEICSTTGTNGGNCNAEFVYKLMKDDVTLTAPTPYDFPYDNLSPGLLLVADRAAVNSMVSQYVSAWNPTSSSGLFNKNGGIEFISQVLSPAYNAINKSSPGSGKIPFSVGDIVMRGVLTQAQQATNLRSVVACAPYDLYNSANFITDRSLYDITIDLVFCGNKLKSPVFDQVWIFPDDRNLTFSNYTQPGHFLHPGKVLRSVVEECGKVKIVTVGTGLSYCGNNKAGEMNAIGNIIVGSILFKNIDLRLKKVFEAAP